MKCHEHGEPLCSLVDGELPEKQAERLKLHLRECPGCREELRVIQTLKLAVKQRCRCAEPPEGFWLGVRARMTELDRAARQPTRPLLSLHPAFAAAAVVVLTVIVGAVMLRSQQRPLPVRDFLLSQPTGMTVGMDTSPMMQPVGLGFAPRIARELPQSHARLISVYPHQIQGQDVASMLYDLDGTPIMLHESVGPGFWHPDMRPVRYRDRVYDHMVSDSQNALTWADEPLNYLMHGHTPLERLLPLADEVR